MSVIIWLKHIKYSSLFDAFWNGVLRYPWLQILSFDSAPDISENILLGFLLKISL